MDIVSCLFFFSLTFYLHLPDLPCLLNTIPGALLIDSAPNVSFPGLPLFTLSNSMLPRRIKFALGHVQARIAGVGNCILA